MDVHHHNTVVAIKELRVFFIILTLFPSQNLVNLDREYQTVVEYSLI